MMGPSSDSKSSAPPLNREETSTGKAEDLIRTALESGAKEGRIIPAETVAVSSWVPWKCRYGCEDYAKTLTCPPHSPTYRETRELLQEYTQALLFQADQSHMIRYLAYFLEREAFLKGFHKALGLGAGPCRLCGDCDVHAPCKRPREARPSMEACGIDVFTTVRRTGFRIQPLRNPKDRQNSFGLILLE